MSLDVHGTAPARPVGPSAQPVSAPDWSVDEGTGHTAALPRPAYDGAARARILSRLTRVQPDGGLLWGWLGPLLVTALGGFLRFWHLATPRGMIFDETYYAREAHDYLLYGFEREAKNPGVGEFVVHPPLGKWAIALGERIFGYNEFGWRFSAAVVGTLMILVLARLARRITGSTLLGSFAGLLLALDGMHFVQSRVAMLDIFLAAWILFAFGFLVLDRDWVRGRLAGVVLADGRLDGGGPWLLWRPWRVAAGVCLGGALATKWTGLYAMAVMGLLAVAWDAGARRTAGAARPRPWALLKDVPTSLASLVLLPAILYVISWVGWMASPVVPAAQGGAYNRDWAVTQGSDTAVPWVPEVLRALWHYQLNMYSSSVSISSPHTYQSHPPGWLLQQRPVAYFYESPKLGEAGCRVQTCASEVLSLGTPFIWWASIAALAGCAWLWLSRRDWRAAAVLAIVGALLLPWLYYDIADNRTMFSFYALPALPFLVLALTLMAGLALGPPGASVRRRAIGATGLGVYTLAVVVNFFGVPGIPGLGLYDILSARVIPLSDWQAKIWFKSWV